MKKSYWKKKKLNKRKQQKIIVIIKGLKLNVMRMLIMVILEHYFIDINNRKQNYVHEELLTRIPLLRKEFCKDLNDIILLNFSLELKLS